LEAHNKEVGKDDQIEAVFRDPEQKNTMGIRAHKEMTITLAFRSLIVPWHAEWLTIWLYFGFALYFWIESFFLFGESK
jgi:hypothetical protein